MSTRAREIRELLHRKTLASDLHRSRVGRALGLSDTETLALAHIALHGELTPAALVDALGLSSGGMTSLLQRLQHAGHVDRRPHPTDRRSILLALSRSTSKQLAELYAPLVADLDATLDALGAQDKAAVARFLRSVVAATEIHARGVTEDEVPGGSSELWT